MFFTLIGLVIAAAGGMLWARSRRPADRPKRSIERELFEGLLPSAVTGRTEKPRESGEWDLRWAEVANLPSNKAEPVRKATRQEDSRAEVRSE